MGPGAGQSDGHSSLAGVGTVTGARTDDSGRLAGRLEGKEVQAIPVLMSSAPGKRGGAIPAGGASGQAPMHGVRQQTSHLELLKLLIDPTDSGSYSKTRSRSFGDVSSGGGCIPDCCFCL